jgi:hypothetical protein
MGQQQPDPFAAPSQQSQQAPNMNAMSNMFGNVSFDGSSGINPMIGGINPMMGNSVIGGGMMGANNNAMAGRATTGVMGNGKTLAPAPADFDDDFGDFEGVSGGPPVGSATASSTRKSSDPFGGLISLDGLSKNSKKEDKLNEPIVINAAAAQYMQDKQQGVGVAAPQNTAKSAAMSFAGIDGLPKSPPPNSMGIGMGGAMGMGSMSYPAASSGMNPSVMGSASSGNASLIGALDPQLMIPQPPKPQQPQGMVGMTPQQQQQQQQQMMQMMMMQNPQMMQQMMMNGGQMTPQQQQQMMQMMMMSQQQMMGGQGGGNMMGGGNNMMGGQGGYMGGQPMGGSGFGGF